MRIFDKIWVGDSISPEKTPRHVNLMFPKERGKTMKKEQILATYQEATQNRQNVQKKLSEVLNRGYRASESPSFPDLMTGYQDSTENVLLLAKMATYSTLKTLEDPQRRTATTSKATEEGRPSESGFNRAVSNCRRQLKHDLKNTENILKAVSDSISVTVDKNGNEHRTEKDVPMMHERLSDGMDLYQTACLAILEEKNRGTEDLTDVRTERKLSKKVYVHADDVRQWEDVNVTGIQSIFRSVRKCASNDRTLKIDPRCNYVYLSELTFDAESGQEETVYRRLPKHYQLCAVDIHGTAKTTTEATTSEADVERTEHIIALLNLTARQTQVLKYMLSGHGERTIANTLGVSKQAVQKTVKQIRQKCINIGFVPDSMKD